MVGSETCQKKYDRPYMYKRQFTSETHKSTMKYSKHTEYFEFTSSELQ